MSRKVKTRKERRYQPRMVSSVKAKPAPPVKENSVPEPETAPLFVPKTTTSQAPSLQSTNEYVLNDLKQVAIITVIIFVLLAVAYLILK